jgi:hypothetical protein
MLHLDHVGGTKGRPLRRGEAFSWDWSGGSKKFAQAVAQGRKGVKPNYKGNEGSMAAFAAVKPTLTKKFVPTGETAPEEIVAPAPIVESLADLAPKVEKTKNQSKLGKLAGVPQSEDEQADGSSEAGSQSPSKEVGTPAPALSREEIAEIGSMPNAPLNAARSTEAPSLPVLSGVMSVLPAPLQQALAALREVVWSAFGYGTKTPEPIDLDALGADGKIPGTDMKVLPDQVVYKTDRTSVGDIRKLQEEDAKKAPTRTVTETVTEVTPTQFARTLSDLDTKIKNGSLPFDKGLEQALAAAETAGVTLEFKQYDPEAPKPYAVYKVPADMIPKELVPADMRTKLGFAQFANVDVEIAVYVPTSALSETVTKTVTKEVPAPAEGGSVLEGESGKGDTTSGEGTSVQPEAPTAVPGAAAPEKDGSLEKGAEAVGQIVGGVYQGGKKVMGDLFSRLRAFLGGEKKGGVQSPLQDTPTRAATTTPVKQLQVVQ